MNINPHKTCFFTKISTIKSAFKATLFSNLAQMGKKTNTLATVALAATLATSPVNAEVSNTTEQAKIACETQLKCQELSSLIQAKINELEKKDSLTKDEKRLRYNLRKQLIATEKSETTLKVDRDSKENNLIEAKLQAQDLKIASLRGALLDK